MGLSGDGRSVIGVGANPDGKQEAWIAYLGANNTLPGDFNGDGAVDAADYVMWRKTDGAPQGYETWRAHFGETSPNGSAVGATGFAGANPAVPEPSTLILMILAAIGRCLHRRHAAYEVAATHRHLARFHNRPFRGHRSGQFYHGATANNLFRS
jgi:hypothetical protein